MSQRFRTMLAIFVGPPVFFLVVFGLAYAAECLVKAGHLALLYGVEPVVSGSIFFETTKPSLIVSNGDRLSRFHLWCHSLSLVSLWLAACLTVFVGVKTCFGRLTGTRQQA